jgi:predicted AlkP superfamily phosphohydrolase/phosphomutase
MDDMGLITALEELTRANLEASRWLIERYGPDLFVCVFMATDRIQHHLWRHLDPSHPRYEPRRSPQLAERILSLYRQLDDALGELAALADPEGLVMVLSDHGFNGCHRSVSINTWLTQASGSSGEPWLTVRPGFSNRARTAARWAALRRIPGLRRLKGLLPGLRAVSFQRAWRLDADDWVDWSRTRAYFSSVGGIRVNLRGREPEGIVPDGEYDRVRSEIAHGLLALRDPESGVQPITDVYRREELYQGPYIDLAPDLIAEPQRNGDSAADNYLIAPGVPRAGSPFGVPAALTGNHDLDGILIAAGPTVRPGQLSGARLWDIAPTICRVLGIPDLADADGVALAGIAPCGASLSPAVVQAIGVTATEPMDPADERDVSERLRALGYLE